MSELAPPVAALIEEFSKLPGIGVKTAQRLTFHVLRSPAEQARRLAEAILRVKESIIYCSRCFNITEHDPCSICQDPQRDRQVVCVVEEPLDVLALERTGAYKGLYHVLHGALSPLEGIGPDNLRIKELLERVRQEEIHEIVLATNPNFEGEYTANYLVSRLKELKPELAPRQLKITSLARGLPIGGDLEYADEGTLRRSIEGRLDLGA
ncbi:recombination mediator RecR [Thermogemmatispora sp.]|uniref:recombination mediator RecR n=1 Tax=Thermogemmatispora sp. TaxID=1968838 RepID=UPI001DDEE491|nr:recombination mediator RecR [Thermogemmatispora sp.]MBX5451688.1 recombination protein RecR [Thermogemmatispora sp.]